MLIAIITGFTALALSLLVLTQVLFLDFFYQNIKMHSIENAAGEIVQALGSEDLTEYIVYWHQKEQLDIFLVDAEGDVLYSELAEGFQAMHVDREVRRELFQKAKENGGTYYVQDPLELKVPKNDRPHNNEPDRQPPRSDFDRSEQNVPPASELKEHRSTSTRLMYARIGRVGASETEYMVLISASLTPVNATVRTLAFQFVIAILVLFALSLVISHLIARKIAKPIIQINAAAKGLASGNYKSPEIRGYREVDELITTLDQAASDLRRSEQLQRELLANVSHDLRTPLTMIIGYGEAIRDLPEEDTHENIQVVIEEAKRLTRLVDDVLDLSKLRAGTQSVDYQTVDLCEIVGRMVTRCHRLVEPNGFSVRFETDEKLVVQADELRLSQAVYNLIGNALAHVGDDQTVVVRAERCETFARVSVIDHGDGISAEDREAIWERYYSRGHAKSNSGVDNTGLGLSIVRAVVDLHGGECGVEDAPQGGSAFWFTIPLSETKG